MKKTLYIITETKTTVDVPFHLDTLNRSELPNAVEVVTRSFNIDGRMLSNRPCVEGGATTLMSTEHRGSQLVMTVKCYSDEQFFLFADPTDEFVAHQKYNEEVGINYHAEFVDCDDDWLPLG